MLPAITIFYSTIYIDYKIRKIFKITVYNNSLNKPIYKNTN